MTTIPDLLFGVLVILAGYGVSLFTITAWITVDDWRTKRKAAYKEEAKYKEICDWLFEEIENELRGK